MQGLKTNSGICLVKGGVWITTGSHAMFADWMHSIADVANYSYRLMELNRSGRRWKGLFLAYSGRKRDVAHPYGYAPLRYITADRSFVSESLKALESSQVPLPRGRRQEPEMPAPRACSCS